MKMIIMLCAAILIACGLPPKEQALSILNNGLKDESVIIRINAAKGLKEIGDRRGAETFYELLKSDDKEAVVAVLNALFDLKEDFLPPAVVKLTKSDNPLIRAEAFRLVSGVKDTACLDLLIAGTTDKIARIRRLSYEGLAKFNQPQIIRKGLSDKDVYTRIAAAKALGMLGEKGMENIIRKELDPKNPNAEIWSAGAIALAAINDTSAVGFIKDLLTDTPWDLRVAAVEALCILKDPGGREVLKTALQSPDPFIRVAAIEIIRRFPAAEFYDLVKTATNDPYINVSIGAVEALRMYHEKKSSAIYTSLFNAPNPLLRIAAATAYLTQ